MQWLFLGLCAGSFIAAIICFWKSYQIDQEVDVNRPDGAYVFADVVNIKSSHKPQTIKVTFDFVVGREHIVCDQVLPSSQENKVRLGKNVPIIYNTDTKKLLVNPQEALTKQRNNYLAGAVVCSLCGSYFILTVFPLM